MILILISKSSFSKSNHDFQNHDFQNQNLDFQNQNHDFQNHDFQIKITILILCHLHVNDFDLKSLQKIL